MKKLPKGKQRCPYTFCGKIMPAKYGAAGVSLSRFDNSTLICSACGTGEALLPHDFQVRMRQHGKFEPGLRLPRIVTRTNPETGELEGEIV